MEMKVKKKTRISTWRNCEREINLKVYREKGGKSLEQKLVYKHIDSYPLLIFI